MSGRQCRDPSRSRSCTQRTYCDNCGRAVLVGTMVAGASAAFAAGLGALGAKILTWAGHAGYPVAVAAYQGATGAAIEGCVVGGICGFCASSDTAYNSMAPGGAAVVTLAPVAGAALGEPLLQVVGQVATMATVAKATAAAGVGTAIAAPVLLLAGYAVVRCVEVRDFDEVYPTDRPVVSKQPARQNPFHEHDRLRGSKSSNRTGGNVFGASDSDPLLPDALDRK